MLQQLAPHTNLRQHACFRPIRARSSRRLPHRVLAQQTGRRWDSEAETASQVRRLIRRDKKEFLGQEDILKRYETEFGEGSPEKAAAPASDTQASAASGTSVPAAPSAKPAAPSSLAAKAAAVAAAKAGTAAAPAAAPAATKFTGGPAASPFGGASKSASPFGASSGSASPFGGSASPFGEAPASTGRSKMEPQGLSPFVSPDPVVPETKQTISGFFSGITLTQVVIVLSFTTIISLMVATFTFVYNVGAIKLAGVD